MRFAILLVVLAAVSATTSATVAYLTATAVITNDPVGSLGSMTGTVYMKYDDATGAYQRRLEFSTGSSKVIEIIDSASKGRYTICSTCTAEAYTVAAEVWWPLSADTQSGTDANGNYVYTRSTGTISQLTLDANSLVPITITFRTGKVVTLSGQSTAVIAASEFDYSSYNCPTKTCNSLMDLVLVLDESGSIEQSDFTMEKQFAVNLGSSFVVSPTAVNLGLVFFGSGATTVQGLTGSLSSYSSAASSHKQSCSNTCIGCGLTNAVAVLNSPVVGRPVTPKVIVLETDGYNNVGDPYGPAATAKALATVIAVGVGSGVSTSFLKNSIASGPSLYVPASDYNVLLSKVSTLTTTACSDYPQYPCGTTCGGFCGCGTCMCKNSKPADDGCTSYTCSASTSYYFTQTKLTCSDGLYCTLDGYCDPSKPVGQGCYYPARNCDDNDHCTTDSCSDPVGSCVHTPVDCNDGMACTDDTCDSSSGCKHTTHSCDDNNKCTTDSCNNVSGCSNVPISCDDGMSCTVDTCNPATGCVHTPLVCDDNNKCTIDTCNNASGCNFTNVTCPSDYCHKGSCNLADGKCVNTSTSCTYCPTKNCEQSWSNLTNKWCVDFSCVEITNGATCVYTTRTCNDNNPCTTDSCNYLGASSKADACKHTRIPVPTQPCAIGVCNTLTGKFDYTNTTCVSTDPCQVSYCDMSTSTCKVKAFCATYSCQNTTCTAVNGSATCSYKNTTCPSSKCAFGVCNPATNACEYTVPNCDDGNVCTDDSCDPTYGCQHKSHDCNTEGDQCTTFWCVNGTGASGTGCFHKEKCNDNNFCTDDSCNPNSGDCLHVAHTCPQNDTEKCYRNECNKKYQKCIPTLIPGSMSDACGSCAQANSNNSAACIGALSWPKFAAVLSAGATAGIVIASVAGFIIFSAVTAAGVRKIIKMANAARGQGAHDNPLYKSSDNEGHNPIYNN